VALSNCSDAKLSRIELETNEPLNNFDKLDEREIVYLAKADPLAISYLYRQHYGAIHCYVNRRIGCIEDTNDIVAEVFMSMVRYLPQFQWTGAPFRCWLLVLTTNQINRWIRKRRFSRFWRPIELCEQPMTGPLVDDDERIEPMRIALLALPLALQTVLTLHYFEGLSIDSIAGIMKCRPGTVKSRLSRGRELLRRKISFIQENTDERRTIGSML
jgi:RNA polymerase sigma-70 factor (ECF subfamily)